MTYREYTSSVSKGSSGSLRADQFFFTVGLCLWLFCRVLQTSYYVKQVGLPLMLGVYGGLVLCIFAELINKGFNSRTFALAAAMLLLIVLLYRVGGNDTVAMLIIAFTSRHYRLRDLLKSALPVLAAAVVFVIASYKLDLISQTYASDGGRLRGSLGFGWVTYLSHYFLEFVMCYALLRGHRITLLEIALLFMINFIIFAATASRNSFILTIVFLVSIVFVRATQHWTCGRVCPSVAAAIFPLSMGISWVLLVMVNPYSGMGYTLDALLSNRIYLTQQALDFYGISAFGNVVTWVTQSSIKSGMFSQSQYLYVDCSYINELINYGWIVSTLLLSALTIVSFKATKHAGVPMGLALIFFAVHGIVDPQLLDLHYCLLLLLLGNVFDDDKEWKNRTYHLAPKECFPLQGEPKPWYRMADSR